MKFATTTTIAAVLSLGLAGTVSAPAFAKKKEEAAKSGAQFSPAFRQAAQPLQTAVQAKDYAAATTALPAAQAAATTPDDKYMVGVLALQTGLGTNDQTLQLQGADLAIQSGKTPPEQLGQFLNIKGVIAYNKGDLQAADAAFTQQYQNNPNDGDNAILLAQTKIRAGQKAAAMPIIEQAIAAKTQSGQPVPEDWYRRALSIAYDGKMPAETAKWGQALVQANPTPTNWRTALQTFRDTNPAGPNDLDVMRLMAVTNALAGERDYYEYANLANNRGLPGEAKAVIDQGMASRMVDNQALKNSKALTEIKNLAAGRIAADKAGLPAADKKARASADAKPAMNTGDAYYGYGMYPQAAELFKLATTKSGADAGTANLRLGEALSRAGQKPQADQAFAAVSGPAKGIATYWQIWSAKGSQAAPTTAPATAG